MKSALHLPVQVRVRRHEMEEQQVRRIAVVRKDSLDRLLEVDPVDREHLSRHMYRRVVVMMFSFQELVSVSLLYVT